MHSIEGPEIDKIILELNSAYLKKRHDASIFNSKLNELNVVIDAILNRKNTSLPASYEWTYANGKKYIKWPISSCSDSSGQYYLGLLSNGNFLIERLCSDGDLKTLSNLKAECVEKCDNSSHFYEYPESIHSVIWDLKFFAENELDIVFPKEPKNDTSFLKRVISTFKKPIDFIFRRNQS